MSDPSEDNDLELGPSIPPVKTLALVKTNTSTNKSNLLQVLDQDYSSIQLTEQEAVQVEQVLRRLSAGSSVFTVMTCTGNRCPVKQHCPLYQMGRDDKHPHGKAPVGFPCILEQSLLTDTLSLLLQEYQVDQKNYTDLNIVTELAEIEVLLWRINLQLSTPEHALLVIDQPIGFDRNTGQPVVQQQVSPLFEQKQKLLTRKSRLQKVMVGDRQEKYKREAALKQKPDTDSSSQMSAVKQQLQLLQTKLRASNQVLEAEEVLSPEQLMSGETDSSTKQ